MSLATSELPSKRVPPQNISSVLLEVEHLKEELVQKDNELTTQAAHIAALTERLAEATHQNDWLKKTLFGEKSEKRPAPAPIQ